MKNDKRIRDIMQTKVHTVYPEDTVFHSSVLMASKNIGTLPVVKQDGTLIGIITDRDIVVRCNALGKDISKIKTCECMSSNPIRTVPSESCSGAMRLMSEYGIRRLPVVENDRLVGLISIEDIAKVSSCCPNEKSPNDLCTLIEIAKGLQKASH